MSNDVLMARTKLPKDHIDLGIGEPHILREAVLKCFNLRYTDMERYDFSSLEHPWEYAPPNGYPALVKLLEERYNAPVVVTIGAKHGIFAALHALKQTGVKSVAYRSPYWASFPFMIESMGLTSVTKQVWRADSYLFVMPNNPDGFTTLNGSSKALNEMPVPVIHDAAYYTESYLPENYKLDPIGDMQVFSASKMYGLSGLRLGWVVCHNREYYNHLMAYVEASTAGVSTVSQRTLMTIIEAENNNPSLRQWFSHEMRSHLEWAQHELRRLDPLVLEPHSIDGMFGWCQKGERFSAESKVHVMDGAAFGDASMVRLNLAVSKSTLIEAIDKLNLLGS